MGLDLHLEGRKSTKEDRHVPIELLTTSPSSHLPNALVCASGEGLTIKLLRILLGDQTSPSVHLLMPLSSSSKTCQSVRRKDRRSARSLEGGRFLPFVSTHKDSSGLDQHLLRLKQTTGDPRDDSSTGRLEDQESVLGRFNEANEGRDGSDHFAKSIGHGLVGEMEMEMEGR